MLHRITAPGLTHPPPEIGVAQDIATVGRMCLERGSLFHVDAAQSAGKLPIDVTGMHIDLLSVTAHKIHGPKGIGALWVRDGVVLEPLLHGGGQEGGVRSGTLSPLLAYEKVLDLPHFWVGSPKRLKGIAVATPQALAKVPVVTHPAPSLLYETIHAWFAAAGVTPARFNTCTSLFISKALAVEGVGVSLLPVEIIGPELASGALRLLKSRPALPSFPLFVAYRRDTAPVNVRRFVERIKACVVALEPAARSRRKKTR